MVAPIQFLSYVPVNVPAKVTVFCNTPAKNNLIEEPLLETATWYQVFNANVPVATLFATSHAVPLLEHQKLIVDAVGKYHNA